MTSKLVRDEVRGEAETWAGVQSPVVDYVVLINAADEPDAGPWLAVDFEIDSSRLLIPGTYVEEGRISFILGRPSGEGDDSIIALADNLASHLRAFTWSDTLELNDIDDPQETEANSGRWYLVQTDCTYRKFKTA